MIGIYKITNPKGKIYIGQSIDIEYRIKSYKKLIRCKSQKKIYNSLIKYGINNHFFEVIEECSIELLNERERYWQDFYNVLKFGLNLKLTNTNDRSGKMSIESRQKMSNAQIGNKKTLGLKRSELQKQMISQRMIGNKPWNKGIKRTYCELKKMSENRKGKMKGENNHMSKLILNTQTGIYYYGIKEACQSFDCNYNSMRDRLNGKTKNKTYYINV